MKKRLVMLLLLAAMAAGGCSSDEQSAIDAFTKLGANLFLDKSGRSVRIVSLRNNFRVTDADLTHVAGLPNLEKIFLDYTNITDAGLKHLKKAPKLQVLYLVGTKITDAGMEQLSEMPQLRYVLMEKTAVTDQAVKDLKQSLPHAVVYNKSPEELEGLLPDGWAGNRRVRHDERDYDEYYEEYSPYDEEAARIEKERQSLIQLQRYLAEESKKDEAQQ